MSVEATFDLGEHAELDGVEELVSVGDGADVDVGEGRLLHGCLEYSAVDGGGWQGKGSGGSNLKEACEGGEEGDDMDGLEN